MLLLLSNNFFEVPEVWKKSLLIKLYANLGNNWLLQKLFNIEPIPILCFGGCILHPGNKQILHSIFINLNFQNHLMGTI